MRTTHLHARNLMFPPANSVKGDLKASMQARVKQYKLDLAVCQETVDGLTRTRKEATERAELLGKKL